MKDNSDEMRKSADLKNSAIEVNPLLQFLGLVAEDLGLIGHSSATGLAAVLAKSGHPTFIRPTQHIDSNWADCLMANIVKKLHKGQIYWAFIKTRSLWLKGCRMRCDPVLAEPGIQKIRAPGEGAL